MRALSRAAGPKTIQKMSIVMRLLVLAAVVLVAVHAVTVTHTEVNKLTPRVCLFVTKPTVAAVYLALPMLFFTLVYTI